MKGVATWPHSDQWDTSESHLVKPLGKDIFFLLKETDSAGKHFCLMHFPFFLLGLRTWWQRWCCYLGPWSSLDAHGNWGASWWLSERMAQWKYRNLMALWVSVSFLKCLRWNFWCMRKINLYWFKLPLIKYHVWILKPICNWQILINNQGIH